MENKQIEAEWKEVEPKLRAARSVADMFKILSDYYELDTCVPGVTVKSFVIVGLKSAIKMLKPLKR